MSYSQSSTLESPGKQDKQNIFINVFSAEGVQLKNH